MRFRWPKLYMIVALVVLSWGCVFMGYAVARYGGRLSPAEDYLWRAPAWVERGGAWWALLGVCLVAAASFVIRLSGSRWRCRGLPLVGLMSAAIGIGVVGGIAARPVNGANIGGGIGVIIGLPIFAIVLVVSAATVVRGGETTSAEAHATAGVK